MIITKSRDGWNFMLLRFTLLIFRCYQNVQGILCPTLQPCIPSSKWGTLHHRQTFHSPRFPHGERRSEMTSSRGHPKGATKRTLGSSLTRSSHGWRHFSEQIISLSESDWLRHWCKNISRLLSKDLWRLMNSPKVTSDASISRGSWKDSSSGTGSVSDWVGSRDAQASTTKNVLISCQICHEYFTHIRPGAWFSKEIKSWRVPGQRRSQTPWMTTCRQTLCSSALSWQMEQSSLWFSSRRGKLIVVISSLDSIRNTSTTSGIRQADGALPCWCWNPSIGCERWFPTNRSALSWTNFLLIKPAMWGMRLLRDWDRLQWQEKISSQRPDARTLSNLA